MRLEKAYMSDDRSQKKAEKKGILNKKRLEFLIDRKKKR